MRSRITLKLFLPVIAVAGLAFGMDQAAAAEISGVKLPDQVTIQGKSLKLNGLGLRQATFAVLVRNLNCDGLASIV